MDPYFYSLQWFPDSRRILFAGSEGVEIIDINSQTSRSISEQTGPAHLTSDGKNIVYLTDTSDQREADIRTYHMEKQRHQTLLSVRVDLSFRGEEGDDRKYLNNLLGIGPPWCMLFA
jgi:hypothetical protein